MPEGLPDVSTSPVAVWLGMAVVVVLALATITDRGLGPISRWWWGFARDRRRAAAERRAADVSELERQVESLRQLMAAQRLDHADAIARQDRELDEVRRELQDRDLRAIAHQRWDLQVLREINSLGGRVPDPPPLWPDPDTT